jgi:hypothetical protein
MKAEGHYQRESTFWDYFLEGLARHALRISIERLWPFMPPAVQRAAEEQLARQISVAPRA